MREIIENFKGKSQSLALAIDLEGERINLEQALSQSGLKELIAIAFVTKRTGALKAEGVNMQLVKAIPNKPVYAAGNAEAVPAISDSKVDSAVAFRVGARGNIAQGQEALNDVGLLLQIASGLLLSQDMTKADDIRDAGRHAQLKNELLRKLFGDKLTQNVANANNLSGDDGLTIDYSRLTDIVRQLAA